MATEKLGYTALDTVTVMKSGGTATLDIKRLGDGGVKFTDLNGNVQVVRDEGMRLLFSTLLGLDA